MPTHYPGSSEEIRALNTYIRFTRAANSLESRLFNPAALEELTISQFGVLEALLHLGPLSQSVLGSKLLKSGANITLVVDNLEKAGLVRRQVAAHDRRVTTVHLTPAGQEKIERLFPCQLGQIVAQFSVLSAAEQETLGALCKKLGLQGKS